MSNEERVAMIRAADYPQEELAALFYDNMPLIHKTIERFARSPADVEDLVQEAFFPFLESVKEYDESAGYAFITDCLHRITWSLCEYAGKQGVVAIPSWLYTLFQKIRELDQAHDGKCPDQLAADVLGVPLKKVREARCTMRSLWSVSLDEADEEGELSPLIDILEDKDETASFERREDREAMLSLWACVETLPTSQAFVVTEYYRKGRTFQEIGEELQASHRKAELLRDAALPALSKMRRVRDLAEIFGYGSTKAYYRKRQEILNGEGSVVEWLAEQREKYGL